MFWNTNKSENEDEKLAAGYAQITEALGNPLTLYRFLFVCIAGNAIIWLAVIILPDIVYRFFSPIATDKIGMVLLSVPLGFGLFSAYCLLRLKFPDVEDNKTLDSELMASFAYQADSARRWLIWLFSIAAGVINVLLLILLDLALSHNL